MPRSLMLVPAGRATGLFVVSLGLVKALNDKGVKAAVFKPFEVGQNCNKDCPKNYSLTYMQALKYLSSNQVPELIAAIVANYERLVKDTQADVIVVEGAVTQMFDQHAINAAIREALNADICMASMGMCPRAMALVKVALGAFGQAAQERFIGGVLYNHDAPLDANNIKKIQLSGPKDPNAQFGCSMDEAKDVGHEEGGASCSCTPFAMIPFESANYALRASDVAKLLGAELQGQGCARVSGISFCAKSATSSDILVTSVLPESTEANLVILCNGTQGLAGKATINTTHSPLAVVEALLSLPVVLFADDTERAEQIAAFSAPLFDNSLLDFLSK